MRTFSLNTRKPKNLRPNLSGRRRIEGVGTPTGEVRMDERGAIRRLKRGDPGGPEALVKSYQVRAVRAACLICRDRALAEDVVQAAFVKVYEKIG